MLSIKDILQATEGRLIQGNPTARIKGVSIDSRAVKAGELFVAIKGERFDGHDFIREVARKSIAAVISHKKISLKEDIPVVLVKDTTQALGRIARAYRDTFDIPVIALTGSAGKTTTKELIAAVLARKYKVLKNLTSHNNHIGVPLTLLRLKPSHEVVITEFGTNQPGDIRWLTWIANPTMAILTNIGESHLEGLKNLAGVFREKIDIVKRAPDLNTIIYNADDRYLKKIKQMKVKAKRIRFAVQSPAEYRGVDVHLSGFRQLEFRLNKNGKFSLPTPVFHNVYNALAAISCGRLFKIGYNDIQKAFSYFRSPQGRQVLQKIGAWWVIDDTYNANPVSLRSAMESLDHLEIKGRKVLVCGDMLELGKNSQQLHRRVGSFAAQRNLDCLITLGKQAQAISQAARSENKEMTVWHCDSPEAVTNRLKEYCRPGDLVLVKGSRGMKMERILNLLKEIGTVQEGRMR